MTSSVVTKKKADVTMKQGRKSVERRLVNSNRAGIQPKVWPGIGFIKTSHLSLTLAHNCKCLSVLFVFKY